MIVAALGTDSSLYKLFLLLHLTCIVVGFGSSFVYPVLAASARSLDSSARYSISHTALASLKRITMPFVYLAGAFGIVLVFLNDEVFKFSQTWISIGFTLFIVGVLFAIFVHIPNLKAMDALAEKLTSGAASPPAGGGPPPEVVELDGRRKRAGMYGGILHLIFLLLMIDMIWKPGLGIA